MKMNRTTLAIFVASFMVGLGSVIAFAAPGNARMMDLRNTMERLNGRAVLKGVIAISGGTSTTNTSTAAPFTISGGSVLMIECDTAAVHVATGASGCSVSHDITNAAFGPQIKNAHDQRYIITESLDTCVAVKVSSGSANCAVFDMQ